MRPVSIKKTASAELTITWDDGHVSPYTLEFLRDACPCAGCKGETILMHEYSAPAQDRSTPGRYSLKDAQQVGSYALQLGWGDGHNTGIYSWQYLRENCPCEECRKGKPDALKRQVD